MKSPETDEQTNLASGSNRGIWKTSGIIGILPLVMRGFVGCCEDTSSDVCPGTVVEWFLLAPHEVGIRILVEMRGELSGSCQP